MDVHGNECTNATLKKAFEREVRKKKKIYLLPSTRTEGETDCRCLRNYDNTNTNILQQKYPVISCITGNEDLQVSVALL